MATMRIRTYGELSRLETFEERFDYLVLRGVVGMQTFGYDRWLNQRFYHSREWRQAREYAIARDLGCDLGVEGYEIHVDPLVHHMNPLVLEDLIDGRRNALDPEFLITTCKRTHNALHYGDANLLPRPVVARQPGDTRLW
jgi:hypothetical protein